MAAGSYGEGGPGLLRKRLGLTPGTLTVLVGLGRGHPACGDFAGHGLRRFWLSSRRESPSGGRPFAGSASRSGPDRARHVASSNSQLGEARLLALSKASLESTAAQVSAGGVASLPPSRQSDEANGTAGFPGRQERRPTGHDSSGSVLDLVASEVQRIFVGCVKSRDSSEKAFATPLPPCVLARPRFVTEVHAGSKLVNRLPL